MGNSEALQRQIEETKNVETKYQEKLQKKDQELQEFRQKKWEEKKDQESKEKKIQRKDQKTVYQHKDDKNSVRLTIFVSFLSMLASLALSNTFGWGNKANGIVAILMSLFSITITSIKLYINRKTWLNITGVDKKGIKEFTDKVNKFNSPEQTRLNTIDDYRELVDEKHTFKEEKWKNHLRLMKCLVFFLSSFNDSTFDFFQGFGALLDENYSDSSRKLLLFASWMGVAEEIIESCIEVTPNAFEDEQFGSIIHYGYLLWSAFESAVGIFILLKFNNTSLVVIGVLCESILLLVIGIVFIYFTLNNIDYHYLHGLHILTVSVCIQIVCSLFSSLFLMDTFELNQRKNGKLIVIMSSINILMQFVVLFFGFFVQNNFWQFIFAVFAPLNDALFRLIHGIGYIQKIQYTVNQNDLLMSSMWIGFSIEMYCLLLLVASKYMHTPRGLDNIGITICGICCVCFFQFMLSLAQIIPNIMLLSDLNETNGTFSGISIAIETLVLIEILVINFLVGYWYLDDPDRFSSKPTGKYSLDVVIKENYPFKEPVHDNYGGTFNLFKKCIVM